MPPVITHPKPNDGGFEKSVGKPPHEDSNGTHTARGGEANNGGYELRVKDAEVQT